MKAVVFSLVAFAVTLQAGEPFVVHEWGTFTSVHASDGALLAGLEREEHRLPNFVRSHAGFSPANKGWDRPVKNVTIKMETPVLYFYAEKETPVTVDVGFNGGSISQWYPERSAGEELPALPRPATDIEQWRSMAPVDFAKGFAGAIQWKATVLAPGDQARITAPKDWETPQWSRARVAEANRVRTPDGAVEGFLFYRGIGNFAPPVRVFFDKRGRLVLLNEGVAPIPFVWVYDRSDDAGPRFRWFGRLGGNGGRRTVGSDTEAASTGQIAFERALVEAGLTRDEAAALLASWKESYFDAPGLRVFWIVPRAFTDRILPLSITPKPDKLERVLVGRSEVLTPAFERELVGEFRKDGGARWVNDRYFLVYRERARQLGVVLPAEIR